MNKDEAKIILKTELSQIKKEMKIRKIRRVSCFNGGLTPDEKYFNSQIFELETKILLCK